MLLRTGLCATVLSSVVLAATFAAEDRPVVVPLPAAPAEITVPGNLTPANQADEKSVDITLQWMKVTGEVAKIPALQQVFDKTFGPNVRGGTLTAVRAKTFLHVCQTQPQVTLSPATEMRLVLGRSGRLIDGEFLDVTRDGQLTPLMTQKNTFTGPRVGISVSSTVTEAKPDVLHLDIEFEQTYLTKALEPGTAPAIQSRVVPSVVDIPSGRTVILPCGRVRQTPLELEDNCELFLAVTAKLVRP